MRRQTLTLLDAHGASLADRDTAPGHLTGSALVVDHAGERVLLILHAKLARWLQPGGHADGDHELAGVALKEATEETGIEGLRVMVPAIDLDIHEVGHGDPTGAHLHLDLRFLVVAPAGAVARGNHESTDLRWVTPAELDAPGRRARGEASGPRRTGGLREVENGSAVRRDRPVVREALTGAWRFGRVQPTSPGVAQSGIRLVVANPSMAIDNCLLPFVRSWKRASGFVRSAAT